MLGSRSRSRIFGSTALAIAAVAALGVAARSSVPAAATPTCTVTPVISADVALTGSTNLRGQIVVPVSFMVSGTCTSAELRAAHWDGDTNNTLGSMDFGYQPGSRPEEVPVGTLDFGLWSVNPAPLNGPFPAGLAVGSTTFLIRRGTSLAAAEDVVHSGKDTTTWSLVGSQYGLPSGRGANGHGPMQWIPLTGRVYYQLLDSGHWVTRGTAVLNAAGHASLAVPDTRATYRFIVPGTRSRMLPDGYYTGGRVPAVF
jgi:hypothetical protein